jgi:UDP-N-acetylmuramoyl-tripeptide--D-alanyl-D-alanine ligase
MTAGLRWTLTTVAEATGGTLVGDGSIEIKSVGTDSRTVDPESLFVAVAGETFDGHEYAEAALTAGASAVLVARSAKCDVAPRVEVDDTITALRDLAVLRRSELSMPVIAITGSTGKTSTKDLLAAAIAGSHASRRSYNNEVGVPLTVLTAPDDATHLIVEVGSRGKGHIAWLMPAVAPDVSVVTNLGVVHLETFGTEAILADSKYELVAGLEAAGTAVIPDDEPRLHRDHPARVVTFGSTPAAGVRVTDLELDEEAHPRFTLEIASEPAPVRISVRLPLAGAHQSLNAAAAMAAAVAVGVDPLDAAAGMEAAEGSPWRMEIHRGSITVVNDAYNANPDSVEAALRSVAAMPGRHIAVLGLMAELGSVEVAEHERIGRLAAELGFAAVVVVGDDPGIARGAGRIARTVTDAAGASRLVRGFLRDGDVVLVKASRAVGLEELALDLAEEATL